LMIDTEQAALPIVVACHQACYRKSHYSQVRHRARRLQAGLD
jgi:hypothetical protein